MVAITPNARAGNFLTINLAAGGGETAWQLEVNRSPDFSSDESIFVAVAAAGAVNISDVVSDTPYYIRARKTNGGNGAWTAAMMLATSAPAAAAAPPYAGFSITPALLVVPEPLTDMVATNVEAGSDVYNLANDDPMSTLRIAAPNTAITFRTTGRPIDMFAILGSLANEQVTWRIRGAASAAAVTAAPVVDTGVVSFRLGTGINNRAHYHAFRRLAATNQLEYWRIDLAGFQGFFMARHLVVGLARASVNISRGAGHNPVDLGKMERTQYGGPDRTRGWRGRAVEFPLSWLSEAEFEAKWRDLDQLVGTTDPVLVLPNPKLSLYLNDRIAFGEIVDMRAEMVRGTKYSRSITVRSLY